MTPTIIFDKDRSVKACVADAWRLLARTWKRYLRAVWIYLILAGSTQALLLELFIRYIANHALPALRLSQSGGDPRIVRYILMPDGLTLLYFCLSAILCIFATYACYGRISSLIQAYKSWNVMPRLVRPALSKTERNCGLRLLGIDALAAFITLLLLAGVWLLAVKATPWLALLIPLFTLYIWTTANVARIQFAVNGQKLKASLRYALRHSLGTPLVVQILTLIPAGLLTTIFSLPILTYMLGSWAAADSLLRGDVTTIPPVLPLLFFIVNTLCLTVILAICSWRTWALSMKCRSL